MMMMINHFFSFHSLPVPKCPDSSALSYGHFGTRAEMSWVRSVLGPKCLDTCISSLCKSNCDSGIPEECMTLHKQANCPFQ